MNIDINIKRKFTINGKEYNSMEEMPDDVRETFNKLMNGRTILGQELTPRTPQSGITINSKVYKSIDEVPQDIRQLYESVLKKGGVKPAPHRPQSVP